MNYSIRISPILSILILKGSKFEKKEVMKKLYLSCAIVFIALSCKEAKKESNPITVEEISITEKIANAHGYENWKNVEQLSFTFNVDRDTTHFERSWIWDTRKQEVTSIIAGDTTTYQRRAVDSTLAKLDAGFINDKYWLLAPFQLIWDAESFTYEYIEDTEAPISGKNLKKLTIVYANEGGYTPGDAYDFYFGDDYRIQEWVFRKGNAPEPSSTTTWEDYITYEGLILSQMHKRKKDDVRISLSGISVN